MKTLYLTPLLILSLLFPASALAGPNTLLVGYKDGSKASRVVASADGRLVENLPAIDVAVVKPQAGESLASVQAQLKGDPRVRYVERDTLIRVNALPNDSMLPQLWGMSKIGAPGAWDGGHMGAGQTVAVIDTGVDSRHSDLREQMWVNEDEIAGNNIDDDRNGVTDDVNGASFMDGYATGNTSDPNGHGTHVAGTIAAQANGTGVVGVAPAARIMAVRFLNAQGSGYLSDAVLAVDYATDNGAKILSNSWGCRGCIFQSLAEAINRSERAGALFVAAAGNASNNNDGSGANYPSSYNHESIVAVAASDQYDGKASFSSYGARSVDLFAPGVAVWSTYPGGSFRSLNGTSMATPHVSGAIAVLWASRPGASAQQVKSALLNGTSYVKGLESFAAYGRLSVPGALEWRSSYPKPPAPPTPPEQVIENTIPPALTGTAEAGGITSGNLACNTGKWNPIPRTVYVSWKVDGKIVPGYERRSFIALNESMIGKTVSCLVRVSNLTAKGEAESAPVTVKRTPLRQVTAPRITGTNRAGSWLTCSPGTYNYRITVLQTEWFSGGVAVRGVASSYRLQNSDRGKKVTCRTTFTTQAFGRQTVEAPGLNIAL